MLGRCQTRQASDRYGIPSEAVTQVGGPPNECSKSKCGPSTYGLSMAAMAEGRKSPLG